jgi:glycosyltransferase involved in cell wall biosynthesis
MLFSVIIPVFNDEKFILSAVHSVLDQGFDDLQVVIVDDASTDRSGRIADDLSVKYDNVVALHNEFNVGVGLSRNNGIAHSSGDYLIFLDSDDVLMDGGLFGLHEVVSNTNEADVVSVVWMDEFTEEVNNAFDERRELVVDDYIDSIIQAEYKANFCWSYIVKRRFILENDIYFIDINVGEDVDFVVKVLTSANKMAYCPGLFYLYRGSGRLSKDVSLGTSVGLLELVVSLYFSLCGVGLGRNRAVEFVLSRIRDVLRILAVRLCLFDDDVLIGFKADADRLSQRVNDSDTFKKRGYIDHHGVDFYTDLLGMVKYLLDLVLGCVDRMEVSKVYLFCASVDSFSAVNILMKHGYTVKGVFDNNKSLVGKELCAGVKVIDVESVEESAYVVVVNPNNNTFLDIKAQLVELGVNEVNISHLNMQ